MIFWTADTHFGQERTLKLSRRKFANVEEMDKTIINNWNEQVGEDDIIYHLGDFGVLENIKKLKGRVVLILGNYEEKIVKENFNGDFEKFKSELLRLGFYDVIEKELLISVSGEFYMTHKPLDCKKDMFNLFGHIHKYCMIKQFGLNVGCDNFNFQLATEDDVNFYKYGIENCYDDDVYCSKDDLK